MSALDSLPPKAVCDLYEQSLPIVTRSGVVGLAVSARQIALALRGAFEGYEVIAEPSGKGSLLVAALRGDDSLEVSRRSCHITMAVVVSGDKAAEKIYRIRTFVATVLGQFFKEAVSPLDLFAWQRLKGEWPLGLQCNYSLKREGGSSLKLSIRAYPDRDLRGPEPVFNKGLATFDLSTNRLSAPDQLADLVCTPKEIGQESFFRWLKALADGYSSAAPTAEKLTGEVSIDQLVKFVERRKMTRDHRLALYLNLLLMKTEHEGIRALQAVVLPLCLELVEAPLKGGSTAQELIWPLILASDNIGICSHEGEPSLRCEIGLGGHRYFVLMPRAQIPEQKADYRGSLRALKPFREPGLKPESLLALVSGGYALALAHKFGLLFTPDNLDRLAKENPEAFVEFISVESLRLPLFQSALRCQNGELMRAFGPDFIQQYIEKRLEGLQKGKKTIEALGSFVEEINLIARQRIVVTLRASDLDCFMSFGWKRVLTVLVDHEHFLGMLQRILSLPVNKLLMRAPGETEDPLDDDLARRFLGLCTGDFYTDLPRLGAAALLGDTETLFAVQNRILLAGPERAFSPFCLLIMSLCYWRFITPERIAGMEAFCAMAEPFICSIVHGLIQQPDLSLLKRWKGLIDGLPKKERESKGADGFLLVLKGLSRLKTNSSVEDVTRKKSGALLQKGVEELARLVDLSESVTWGAQLFRFVLNELSSEPVSCMDSLVSLWQKLICSEEAVKGSLMTTGLLFFIEQKRAIKEVDRIALANSALKSFQSFSGELTQEYVKGLSILTYYIAALGLIRAVDIKSLFDLWAKALNDSEFSKLDEAQKNEVIGSFRHFFSRLSKISTNEGDQWFVQFAGLMGDKGFYKDFQLLLLVGNCLNKIFIEGSSVQKIQLIRLSCWYSQFIPVDRICSQEKPELILLAVGIFQVYGLLKRVNITTEFLKTVEGHITGLMASCGVTTLEALKAKLFERQADGSHVFSTSHLAPARAGAGAS